MQCAQYILGKMVKKFESTDGQSSHALMPTAQSNRHTIHVTGVIMVALWNKADHYIFAL